MKVPAGGTDLSADVSVPGGAEGLVIFAHGSGSSRLSARNRRVAAHLNGAGIATMLIDLLSESEEAVDLLTRELRFDIGMLGSRLVQITDWVAAQPELSELGLGYFGASTGAAAALVGAAQRSSVIQAVVSRGGRPDLAEEALRSVRAPSLFIVGSYDDVVLRLNREAMTRIPRSTETRLEIVEGATHLFEEPGALEQVATLAGNWFGRHLRRVRRVM